MKTKTNKTTAIATWDEELAKAAAEAAKQEANTGGGQYFSLRGGQLKLNGALIPNNEMVVCVLDALSVNALYEGEYDADNPQSPVCYAFGRSDDEMGPHEASEKKQSDDCQSCEHNKFGSAEKGRGKACKNGRRLALIAAGTLDDKGRFAPFDDSAAIEKGQIAFLNVPPTSINPWGAYVKQLSSTMLRPPYGVFTRIKLVPDPKTQIKLTFECQGQVPNALGKIIMQRRNEALSVIEAPFPKGNERTEKPAKKTNAPVRRKY